jgi:hypothetical protein
MRIRLYTENEDIGGCVRLYDRMGYMGERYPPI